MTLCANGEAELVFAGKRLGTSWFPGKIASVDGCHAESGGRHRRKGVAQVPDQTVHPRRVGERLFRLEPVCGDRWWCRRTKRLVMAGIRADDLTMVIQHFKFYFTLGLR